MIPSEKLDELHHNHYIMDKGNFKPWKKGGYGTLYLSETMDYVMKKMAKYEIDYKKNIHHLRYATVLETCLTKTLHSFPYFTKIQYIDTSASDVFICQRFMGYTLHQYLKEVAIPLRKIPSVVYQLIDACWILQQNGLQHTDIKPTNIVIRQEEGDDYNYQVSLIDYNCMSQMALGQGNELTWTETVGTWQYVAPEILLEDKVHNNSCVWSIGLIITTLLDVFPLVSNHYPCVPDGVEECREKWTNTLLSIFKEEGEVGVFQKINGLVPLKYRAFFKKIFVTNPIFRYSLGQLRKDWAEAFELKDTYDETGAIGTHYHLLVKPYKGISLYSRRLLLELLYKFCEKWEQMHKFYRTVHVFDRCSHIITQKTEYAFLFGSWVLCSFMLNEHLNAHEEALQYISNIYQLTVENLCNTVWMICEHSEWNVYEKGADVWVKEAGGPVYDDILSELLVTQEESYSMKSLCEKYLKSYSQWPAT